jgi:hypothetical protein
MAKDTHFAWVRAHGARYHIRMTRSWGQLGLVGLALLGLAGCSDSGDETLPELELGQLTAVEITTVTTVQASSGVFLSPRPRQARPRYVQTGVLDNAEGIEPSEVDRVKVDSALLFQADARGRALLAGRFESSSDQPLPQHFFPVLEAADEGARWDIALRPAGSIVTDDWTEWGGWRAYPGLRVGADADGAIAATLDYEALGLRSPLTLTMNGERVIVTNHSQQAIHGALLIYDHADGVGVELVDDLDPGGWEDTATGPKEHNPERLLLEARERLEAFMSERLGAEFGPAVARAKSVPFLETPGLRLVYLLDEQQAPAPIALPEGLAARQRFVICQAEVMIPSEEQHTLELLRAPELDAVEVTLGLGRFARAKLEGAKLLGDAPVQAQAATLLETLTE